MARGKGNLNRVLASTACAALLVMLALAGAAPPGFAAVALTDVHQRGGSRSSGGCKRASDCDDGLPCTEDTCVNSSCVHTPVPECVSCTVDPGCAAIDLVFLLDTSGSMRDEAAALCASIPVIVAELESQGIAVHLEIFGISELPRFGFDCVTDHVVNVLGAEVPGDSTSCQFPDGSGPHESWGPATAIVAGRYLWTAGAERVIVPIADEGPCNGSLPDGCNDPGDDRASIDNAISIATANGVVVSPIVGTGAGDCVLALAAALADGTGGLMFPTNDPDVDFVDAVTRIVEAPCVKDFSCDDGNACTVDDTCRNSVCLGAEIVGCQACNVAGQCDDGDACTDEDCLDGRCSWTVNFDGAVDCCDPLDGSLMPLTDGSPCTLDVCDELTGDVSHPPAQVGIECDDGDVCTMGDACDGDGACAGTDLNTITCTGDVDCAGQFCDATTGLCVCRETPDLCVNYVGRNEVVGTGDPVAREIEFQIQMGYSTNPIIEGLFALEYDPNVLRFSSIAPGDVVAPSSPFSRELHRDIDETNGVVRYRVAVAEGASGVRVPAVLAAARFFPMGVCADGEVCLSDPRVETVVLRDQNGDQIQVLPCCNGRFIVTPFPALQCPPDATVDSDAGQLSAEVTWDPPTATSRCGVEPELVCTGVHSEGYDLDLLIAAGGRHPAGVSRYACTAVDSFGIGAFCEWTVEVREQHLIQAEVEISPLVAPGPMERCIEFEFFASPDKAPLVVQQPVVFGRPFNLPGRSDPLLLEVPAGGYVCATARDPKHTLRSVVSVEIIGTRYVAKFVEDPSPGFGGDRLLSGNLNDDAVIDVLDYAILTALWGISYGSGDTPCELEGAHADINGDGLVDLDDFAFVSRNFLVSVMQFCGVDAGGVGAAAGLTEVTVSELQAMGLGELTVADLNGDGLVNVDDMRAFEQGARPR